ncbi:MAG: hypothetical protein OSJ38_02780 [Lachnospiraceae bacterium]|nr:hypothetical protein [Lachnospiraceae bacterium]
MRDSSNGAGKGLPSKSVIRPCRRAYAQMTCSWYSHSCGLIFTRISPGSPATSFTIHFRFIEYSEHSAV